ncbi:hypothetical protein [Streptococcus gallolyticus]|uniref:hypothetical protein n=1 Tax=Streptococcus gallolyticus TaxID=315405 RepID=UPI00087FD278|nr:hypothetical protein [Streptococcus gallolyticus]SDJ83600.1 hypothetical protein SAMN04487842_0818 [Streptococcus gallolyticus]SDL33608.1 hypothetical protein SAMN04487841_0821 [Streptococcus gallolyticus]
MKKLKFLIINTILFLVTVLSLAGCSSSEENYDGTWSAIWGANGTYSTLEEDDEGYYEVKISGDNLYYEDEKWTIDWSANKATNVDGESEDFIIKDGILTFWDEKFVQVGSKLYKEYLENGKNR